MGVATYECLFLPTKGIQMKKEELVEALARYAESDSTERKQACLARFLSRYFNSLGVPPGGEYHFLRIEEHIPQLLLSALEMFRTTNKNNTRELREGYEEEAGCFFPELTSIGYGDVAAQYSVTRDVAAAIVESTDLPHLEANIGAVLNAERNLLQQRFYQFIDSVFKAGLFDALYACPTRGMSGKFGNTLLRGYTTYGEVALTFMRAGESREQSVSFTCYNDTPLGFGSRMVSVHTDLRTALGMIEDVIWGWPTDQSGQARAFRSNENVH